MLSFIAIKKASTDSFKTFRCCLMTAPAEGAADFLEVVQIKIPSASVEPGPFVVPTKNNGRLLSGVGKSRGNKTTTRYVLLVKH